MFPSSSWLLQCCLCVTCAEDKDMQTHVQSVLIKTEQTNKTRADRVGQENIENLKLQFSLRKGVIHSLRLHDPVLGFAQAEGVNKCKAAQLKPVNSAQAILCSSAC